MITQYFFPSFLSSIHPVTSAGEVKIECSIESGKKAIQLLLRSFELPAKSSIAIPAFVCESVAEAVVEENFIPVLLDLKNDFSFWTEYDKEKMKAASCKVVILAHLYGFIHPDSEAIVDFCKKNSIFLIQDAAQSYGIDKQKISAGNGIVYSFGPGKSTTAANGAMIEKCNMEFYKKNITQIQNHFVKKELVNAKSKLFLKSRIYGNKLSLKDKISAKVVLKFSVNATSTQIFSMTNYQRSIAATSIQLLSSILPVRKANYALLQKGVKTNTKFSIPYESVDGLCFKCIVFVKTEAQEFKNYLYLNNVPYFTLFNESDVEKSSKQLKYFLQNAAHFFEFSCEASIPEEEIKRVATLLAAF